MAGYFTGLYPMTPAERAVEPAIAALGLPYRTQFPCYLFGMGKWFPDFLMPTIGVVLEVDDDSHFMDPEKQKADALRTSALAALGYLVVRCTNEEALNDPEGTVKRLVAPHVARKGPGLPQAKFKQSYKKKKSNVGSSPSRSSRSVARPPHPSRVRKDQGVKDQGR